MMVRPWRIAPLQGLLLALAAAALASPAIGQEAWYKRDHGRAPTAEKVYVCHGYTCRIVSPVRFSAAEIARIAGPLTKGVRNADAERAAISKAVQTYERIVGARVGTANDLPKMQFGRGADDQMDCIDEATNTTSLLLLLSKNRLLKFHKVEAPAARGFFLDGRYPHATAVLTDTRSGEKWAIDSWPRANAEPPVIQPLALWKRARPGDTDS
jgi:hypothetical protein